MAEDSTQYTDRLNFPATLMFMLQQMSIEAARDGFCRQFEDQVDLLIYCVDPLLRTDEHEEVIRADLDGADLRPDQGDQWSYGVAKRRRIKAKLLVAIRVMHRNKLLLKHVEEGKYEFNPSEILVRKPDG